MFWYCNAYELPIVWNLAGGYQRESKTGSIEPVLALHRQTMREGVAAYEL